MMKHVQFRYDVAAVIALTGNELAMLAAGADAHYDSKCRQQLLAGRSLATMQHQFCWGTHPEGSDLLPPQWSDLPTDILARAVEFTIRREDLDTICKIAESPLIDKSLTVGLRAILRAANDRMEHMNREADAEGERVEAIRQRQEQQPAASGGKSEPIACDLCGNIAESTDDAIARGWEPTYWIGDDPMTSEETGRAICPACADSKCHESEYGDLVLNNS